MPVKVTPLAEGDIPGVVTAIQEAFGKDDPYHVWMFDTEKFDRKRNSASLSTRCRWGMRNQLFLVAKEEGSDKVLGVAMWLLPQPVGARQTWYSWFEDWRLYFNQVAVNLWYGRGGLNVKRYYIFRDGQDRAHSKCWTDPRGYYFLNIMVVVPEARRRGIGRQLVAAVTDRADKEQMPCYLESSKDIPNMQIYERMGFRFEYKMDCDDDDVATSLFCMVRDPRPPAAE